MILQKLVRHACVALVFAALVPHAAGQYAAAVVDYNSGVVLAPAEPGPPFYNIPDAALGLPDHITGETGLNPFGGVLPNVLSPFSPAYEADEIVEIGPGGQLTLRLSHYVLVGPGYDLGIFGNVGMIGEFDPQTFELLGAANPASVFGAESAALEVSQDGNTWVALNGGAPILFDMPSNYYQNAGVFDGAPPANPVLADFGQPIAPDLSVFDGQTEAGVLAALGGSAGGYWLDLSPTGLPQIGYLRFSVPAESLPAEPYSAGDLDSVVFELDAVSIANGKVGGQVPEPTSITLLGLALLLSTIFRCQAARRAE